MQWVGRARARTQLEDPWVEYVDEFGRTRTCRRSELPAPYVLAHARAARHHDTRTSPKPSPPPFINARTTSGGAAGSLGSHRKRLRAAAAAGRGRAMSARRALCGRARVRRTRAATGPPSSRMTWSASSSGSAGKRRSVRVRCCWPQPRRVHARLKALNAARLGDRSREQTDGGALQRRGRDSHQGRRVLQVLHGRGAAAGAAGGAEPAAAADGREPQARRKGAAAARLASLHSAGAGAPQAGQCARPRCRTWTARSRKEAREGCTGMKEGSRGGRVGRGKGRVHGNERSRGGRVGRGKGRVHGNERSWGGRVGRTAGSRSARSMPSWPSWATSYLQRDRRPHRPR